MPLILKGKCKKPAGRSLNLAMNSWFSCILRSEKIILELTLFSIRVWYFSPTDKGEAERFLTMEHVNFTITTTQGWEKQCKEWANANKAFEVRGIKSQDFEFCQNFCAHHQYRYKYKMCDGELVAVFTPISVKQSATWSCFACRNTGFATNR